MHFFVSVILLQTQKNGQNATVDQFCFRARWPLREGPKLCKLLQQTTSSIVSQKWFSVLLNS